MTFMDEQQTMPLVSAVITTHNRKDLIQKAIESVQKQTYLNLETIVVDDASTDGTPDILAPMSEEGQFQYIYIPKEESKGGNHARNVGILAAKGKYIALLDDDDEWLPEKTEKQVAMLECHPDCGVCHCGKIRDYNFGERQILREPSELPEGDLSREILIHVVCTTSVMMIERMLLLETGLFDEDLRYWQEYELCMRLFQKTKIAVVRENLVLYRIVESDKNRLTNKIAGWEESVAQIYKKHAEEIKQLSGEERNRMELFMYHDGASRCNACGDRKRLRKYLFKIFRVTKSPKDLFKAVTGQYELRGEGNRILFLSGSYQNRGGVISTLTLMAALKEKGYEVGIVIGNHGNAESIESRYGVQSYYIKSYNWTLKDVPIDMRGHLKIQMKKAYNFYAEQKLYRYIKTFNPDIVVLNSSDQYVGTRACNRLGIPIVMYFREFMTLDHGRRYWSDRMAKKYMSKLDGGIAISKAIKEYFCTMYSVRNVQVIYNGIDVRRYVRPVAERSSDTFKISCVGRLCDGKNQLLAIKAARQLVDSGVNNFHIFFYGDDVTGYTDVLNDYAQSVHITEYVSFMGATDRVEEMYSDAHINLLCSRSEAFGRVIIEGMMNHCLSIVTNSGGAKEIVQDKVNGLLFENDDEVSLYTALAYALNHYEQLQAVIERGYEDAMGNYTAEINTTKVEHYLLNLQKND